MRLSWCVVLKCAVAALSIAAAVDAQSERYFRLPNNTRPVGYDIALVVDLKESNFSGTVQIELEAVQQTNVVVLNVKELELSNIVLIADNGQRVGVPGWVMQNDSEIVRFNLDSYLIVQQIYYMTIQFAGNITDDLKGLYKSSYFRETEERFVATTFNAAAYARKIFPCYDEPQFKAKFKLRVSHAEELRVLSNMPIENRTALATADKLSLTTFAESPPMSSYLLAFVVSDFSALQLDATFSAHAQSSVVNTTRYALNFTKNAIAHLAQYFKRPYQLKKLDIVAIDDFLMGAMENWGLITYKTSRIVYRDGREKTAKLQSVTKIVFHELIHQWFGNEVTCAWWSYVWLNEGFTVFLESYILNQMHPEWMLMEQFLVNEMHPVMERDVLPTTRAMTKVVYTPEQIGGIYDFVVYPKAASVIRMFQSVVGTTVFDAFVVRYLEDRSFKASTEDDMIRVLQSAVDEHHLQLPAMDKFVKSWTNNPSYPLVAVHRDYVNAVTVSAVPVNTFYIPLPWISQYGKSGFAWLSASEASKLILVDEVASNEWILFNPNQMGYYRVSYDQDNWKLLIADLKRDHSAIPKLSRAQLIDDALFLARDNRLDIEILLDILSYLPQETELIPLKAGFKALQNLDRVLRGNNLYSSYHQFQKRILEQIYDKMLSNHLDDHISKLYRAEVRKVACEFGVPKCLQEALALFEGFDSVEPDLRGPVICGSMKGSENYNIWAMVVRRMVYIVRNFEQKRINVEEFDDILYGFGCAVSEDRLNHYVLLSLSNTETIEMQDRVKMFNYIASSGVNGTDIALSTLVNDSNTIQRRYGSLAEVVDNLRYTISTQKQLQTFAIFMHSHTLTGLNNLQNEVYEAARANVRWASEKLPKIANWTSPANGASDTCATKLMLIVSFVLCTFIN